MRKVFRVLRRAFGRPVSVKAEARRIKAAIRRDSDRAIRSNWIFEGFRNF